MKKIEDGSVFNFLTVIGESHLDKSGKRMLKCRCECGNEVIVNSCNLGNGHTKSCGCGIAISSHKMSNERPYRIWKNLISRIKNKNTKNFSNYGGRGICVCSKWESFSGFWEDMQSNYSDELTLDRKDNNGDYCAKNCQWADRHAQSRNTSRNKWFTVGNKTMVMADWADLLGISRGKLRYRLIVKGEALQEVISNKQQNER